MKTCQAKGCRNVGKISVLRGYEGKLLCQKHELGLMIDSMPKIEKLEQMNSLDFGPLFGPRFGKFDD